MQKEINVYIGWDDRDIRAADKCAKSIIDNSSIEVNINILKDIDMRREGYYWRSYHVDRCGQMWDDRDGVPMSTKFTYLRYLTPIIDQSDGWFLFCDPDMMFRRDILDLIKLADKTCSVMVVKHFHKPKENKKMGEVIQTAYERKNWTSLMLFNSELKSHISLTPYEVNMRTKNSLHSMCWVDDCLIGKLPEEWNWLEGYSPVDIDPAVVHFTRGTPDMLGDGQPIMYSDEWNRL